MAGLITDANPKRAALIFFAISWTYYLNDLYLIALSGSKDLTLLWSLDVLFYTLIPSATLIYLYRRGALYHVREGFHRPRRIWMVLLAALVLALATHVVFTLHVNIWLHRGLCCALCASYAFPHGEPWHHLMIVYAAVSAGVMEEIVFRAHLVTALERVLGPRIKDPRWQKAAVFFLASALFALAHWCEGPGKLVSAFLLGLIPTAMYMRTRNLWLPVIWHTLHDAFAMSLNG